jgi:proliferating cell nuclear antigen
MIVRLDNPKLMSDGVGIISEIVSEVRIKLLEDGMSVVAVDPANIAMVIFRIPKESFAQYESSKEVWGVNLEDFRRILKRTASASSIIFEQEDNQLKISIFDKLKKSFVLSLIDVESEEKQEPNLEFSCEANLGSDDFSKAVEDCAVVADSCSFSAGKDFFIVEGNGSLNSARVEFSQEESKISGIGKSKYSLEYLAKFTKAKIFSDKVRIRFSDNYPVRLDFAGEKMGIGFILAPRVEND